ncbi:tripartite tricarboxylate transporter substrate binding protein [Ramlibacter sp. G-1-2-2]|uniref:Tripartite tricarboxylate transporter substrate binding protein n=1 Tax=Ramlibacter agri TaxID=2728837 RepID=A0A848HH12_9BURK|nr:tripartite tricarboxylate transporter substrate binding protein [Ramlibacter agri]NML48719.1 tripartite tricarboxylate transporter substrate binding protein [Ramlibacter agri]
MKALNKWFRGLAASAIAAACAIAVPVSAQNYPGKAVTLIVPFPAGGVTDASARLVARKLAEELKQPVVVENRPGAGASIGANAVAKAAPDGYTLLVGTMANIVVNPYVYKDRLPYDPRKDLAPVHGMMGLPLVIVARADRPYKTIQGVVEAARKKPQTVTFASAGNGSVAHLAGELFQAETKSSLVHVPYKGSAPAITDLLGGMVDLAFDYASTTEQNIKAGKLTGLAVTGNKRLPSLPNVPTLGEAGFPNAEVTSWIGIFAPAATPAPVLHTLDTAMATVLKDKEVLDGFAAAGGTALPLGATEFKGFIESEHRRWKPVIEKANIQAN